MARDIIELPEDFPERFGAIEAMVKQIHGWNLGGVRVWQRLLLAAISALGLWLSWLTTEYVALLKKYHDGIDNACLLMDEPTLASIEP